MLHKKQHYLDSVSIVMKTSKRDSGGGSTQLAATSTGGSGGSQQQLTGGYKTREKQLGDVEKRINESEKNLAKLCEDFGAIARKTARLRDKGDILAEDLLNMADHEHKSGKQALQQSAQLLSLVQDYRQTQIERLEHKVTVFSIIAHQARPQLGGHITYSAITVNIS